MEQANSKNKIVRAAALEALAEHDRPEIVKLFDDLIKGNAFDVLARPFRAIRSWHVLRSMLDEGKKTFEQVLRGDEQQQPRFWKFSAAWMNASEFEERNRCRTFVIDCFLQMREARQNQGQRKISAIPSAVISWVAWHRCCMSSALPELWKRCWRNAISFFPVFNHDDRPQCN